MSSANNDVWQSLRLDPDTIQRALDELDKKTTGGIDRNRRSRRFKFRNEGAIVDVRQPGSVKPSRFRIITRDVSAGGMSFLHRGYLHAESRCTFVVTDSEGNPRTLAGSVVRSDYLTNGAHLVSCKFDKAINVMEICDAAEDRTVALAISDKNLVKELQTALGAKRVSAIAAEVDPDTIHESLGNKTDGLMLVNTEYTESIVESMRKKAFVRAIIVLVDDPEADGAEIVTKGATMAVSTPPTEAEIDSIVELLHRQGDEESGAAAA